MIPLINYTYECRAQRQIILHHLYAKWKENEFTVLFNHFSISNVKSIFVHYQSGCWSQKEILIEIKPSRFHVDFAFKIETFSFNLEDNRQENASRLDKNERIT